jgi:hypothetical protein
MEEKPEPWKLRKFREVQSKVADQVSSPRIQVPNDTIILMHHMRCRFTPYLHPQLRRSSVPHLESKEFLQVWTTFTWSQSLMQYVRAFVCCVWRFLVSIRIHVCAAESIRRARVFAEGAIRTTTYRKTQWSASTARRYHSGCVKFNACTTKPELVHLATYTRHTTLFKPSDSWLSASLTDRQSVDHLTCRKQAVPKANQVAHLAPREDVGSWRPLFPVQALCRAWTSHVAKSNWTMTIEDYISKNRIKARLSAPPTEGGANEETRHAEYGIHKRTAVVLTHFRVSIGSVPAYLQQRKLEAMESERKRLASLPDPGKSAQLTVRICMHVDVSNLM